MQCRVDVGGDGGGGAMRTVECLRGRLLAERVASKAAKEESDQLAKRLDELEKKLADEIKVRNAAERRLRRAVKRLESLKILDVGLSDSSVGSLSSSACCSAARPPAEAEETHGSGSLSSADGSAPRGEANGWGGDGDSARGASSSAGSCAQGNFSSMDGSWCSVLSEQSQTGPSKEAEEDCMGDGAKNCRSDEGAGDYDPASRSQEPVASNGSTKSEAQEELYRDAEDDRLALVPVDHPRYADGSRTGDGGGGTPAAKLRLAGDDAYDEEAAEGDKNRLAIVPVDDVPSPPPRHDVQSVLLALRQVKEQLRCTIERTSPPELAAGHHELCGH